MAERKSGKQGKGHPLEKNTITQEMLDKIARLKDIFIKTVAESDKLITEGLKTADENFREVDKRMEFFQVTADENFREVDRRFRQVDKRIEFLEFWAFLMTILINDLRGSSPDIERSKRIAENFNLAPEAIQGEDMAILMDMFPGWIPLG